MSGKVCHHCQKSFKECKCTLDNIRDNRGTYSPARFGCDSLDLSFVMMDKQMVLKIKLFNDVIYLNHEGISHLASFAQDFLDIKESIYQKQLMDWDCNHCGKKTNNMQEVCDECQDRECDCD